MPADAEGLSRIEVNRTCSWYSPEGDMRSTLAAILDLYGFNIWKRRRARTRNIPGQPANRPSTICSTSNGAGRRDTRTVLADGRCPIQAPGRHKESGQDAPATLTRRVYPPAASPRSQAKSRQMTAKSRRPCRPAPQLMPNHYVRLMASFRKSQASLC